VNVPLEVCIDRTDGLTACLNGGADRIELCSSLSLGGLTPSFGFMEAASKIDIPVHAMIRPHAGGFVFERDAVEGMLADIKTARDLGLAGVVIGALNPNHDLDLDTLSQLIRAAGDMEITLHRAFDLTRTPAEALELAIDLGIHRIYTGVDEVHASCSVAKPEPEIIAAMGVCAAADQLHIRPHAHQICGIMAPGSQSIDQGNAVTHQISNGRQHRDMIEMPGRP